MLRSNFTKGIRFPPERVKGKWRWNSSPFMSDVAVTVPCLMVFVWVGNNRSHNFYYLKGFQKYLKDLGFGFGAKLDASAKEKAVLVAHSHDFSVVLWLCGPGKVTGLFPSVFYPWRWFKNCCFFIVQLSWLRGKLESTIPKGSNWTQLNSDF